MTITSDYSGEYKSANPPGKRTKRCLHAGDACIALIVVGPMVIMHWRGTWALMDRRPDWFTPWRSVIWGLTLCTLIVLLRELLFTMFSAKSGKNGTRSRSERCLVYVFTKLYAFVFSMGCNMHWKGAWALLDAKLGIGYSAGLSETLICTVLLIFLQSVRNLSAAPMMILADSKDISFRFPTRFRIEWSQETGLYILDCLFSVIVIGSLVVFVWRGVWVICDLLIFPLDFEKSAWASVIIGYVIVIFVFSMQSTMRWTCERLTGFSRLAAADIFLFLGFVGTVNVWRGIWNLCDIYCMPDNKYMGDLLSHIASFLLLALLNCSNSVLVRGVYIDAEEPAGQCVIFPVYYVRLFFQKERTKKQRRLMDALDKQDLNATPLLLSGDNNNQHGEKPKPVIVPARNNSAPSSVAASKELESQLIMNTTIVEHISEKTNVTNCRQSLNGGEHTILRSDSED